MRAIFLSGAPHHPVARVRGAIAPLLLRCGKALTRPSEYPLDLARRAPEAAFFPAAGLLHATDWQTHGGIFFLLSPLSVAARRFDTIAACGYSSYARDTGARGHSDPVESGLRTNVHRIPCEDRSADDQGEEHARSLFATRSRHYILREVRVATGRVTAVYK